MTSLKFLRFLMDKLETPYVVSYFFNGLLTIVGNGDRQLALEEARAFLEHRK